MLLHAVLFCSILSFLAGHFVQGHVDCTGDIVEKYSEGDSMWFKVCELPV
jgi:riboflavin synthase alpha subunit